MFGSSIRIFYSSSFSDVYIDSDNEEDFGFLANTLSSAGMNFDRKITMDIYDHKAPANMVALWEKSVDQQTREKLTSQLIKTCCLCHPPMWSGYSFVGIGKSDLSKLVAPLIKSIRGKLGSKLNVITSG